MVGSFCIAPGVLGTREPGGYLDSVRACQLADYLARQEGSEGVGESERIVTGGLVLVNILAAFVHSNNVLPISG